MTQAAPPNPRKSEATPRAYLLSHPVESLSPPIAVLPTRTTVGRSPGNTIVINDRSVSRRHAVIISRDGNYYVNDMSSHNGTYINGKKISISAIDHHDRIAFGNQTFLFLRTSDPKTGSRATEHLIDPASTIALHHSELDPSHFLAYAVDNTQSELFSSEEGALTEQAMKPFQQAHHRLTLLYKLSERLRSTRDLKRVLVNSLDLVLEAVSPAQRALVLLRSGPGGTLNVAASRHRTDGKCDEGLQISRTLLDWVITEKMALMSQNMSDDIRLKDSESVQMGGQSAVICVPIIAREKFIGVLYVDSDNLMAELTQEDAAFTAAVANELALTIANIRLQKTLIRNERMTAIGRTVANLAHNIKNLTMMNQNAMDLMRMHLERIGDEQADKCWGMVNTSTSRISDLAMEMLAYVGEQPLNPAPTDINRAIRSSLEALTQRREEMNVDVKLDLATSLPTWEIDEKLFQQALINLVVNAMDAVKKEPAGEIHISTALRSDRRLIVSVRDNGCGMDPEEKNKIFDLFFTTKGTRGNGMGLPMVSKFIELSGAKLLVNSAKNEGTTLKMIFP
jgi:signal transduction histidine kinase